MLRHYEPPNSERESMRTDTDDHIVVTGYAEEETIETEVDRKKMIEKLIALKIHDLQLFIIFRMFIILVLLLHIRLQIEAYVLLFSVTGLYIIAGMIYFHVNRKFSSKKTKVEHMMNVLMETFLLSSLAVCSLFKIPYTFCCAALFIDFLVKMYFSCGCSNDVS